MDCGLLVRADRKKYIGGDWMNFDLIDRRKAIEDILKESPDVSLGVFNAGVSYATDLAFRKLYNAPAVDAVQVIRCGDCVYYDQSFASCTWCHKIRQQTDYCSKGKKRKGKR